MTITDMFVPVETLERYDLGEGHLPEEIQETAFVWLLSYDKKTDKEIPMLVSRSYVEKVQTTARIRPAVGVYEILWLASHYYREKGCLNIDRPYLETVERLLNTFTSIALDHNQALRERASNVAYIESRREGAHVFDDVEEFDTAPPPSRPERPGTISSEVHRRFNFEGPRGT
jgi:hypothetical protein